MQLVWLKRTALFTSVVSFVVACSADPKGISNEVSKLPHQVSAAENIPGQTLKGPRSTNNGSGSGVKSTLIVDTFAQDSTKPYGIQIYLSNFGVQHSFQNDSATWSITFRLDDNRTLTAAKKIYAIRWRLFDRSSDKAITAWAISDKNQNGITFDGPLARTWSVEDSDQALKAINFQKHVYLEISVNSSQENPWPTHYVDLGAACTSSANSFISVDDGKTGCHPIKPPQPTTMSPTSAKLNESEIRRVGDDYCHGVSRLATEFHEHDEAEMRMRDQVAQEVALAKKVCNANEKYVGFSEISDLNIRAMAEAGAMREGYFHLFNMVQVSTWYGISNLSTDFLGFYNRYERDIALQYGNYDFIRVFGAKYASNDFLTRQAALERWGRRLNDYYRNQ